MSAVLALTASLLYGAADYLGGSLTRRLRAVQVLAVSQVLSCVVLALVLGVGFRGSLAGAGWLGWALLAGTTWAVAMGALYTALARGTMGVVAPIAACGMVLPVVLSVAAGERPSPLQGAGVVLAVAGVVASAGPDLRSGARGSGLAVGLAAVAAVLFGVELFALARGSDASVGATLLGMRLSSAALVVAGALATRRSAPAVTRRDLPPLLALGVLDVGATAAYAVATTAGMVSVAVVLSSLYPAVTVLLARRLLGERLRPLQVVGLVAVLLGAVAAGAG